MNYFPLRLCIILGDNKVNHKYYTSDILISEFLDFIPRRVKKYSEFTSFYDMKFRYQLNHLFLILY